MERGAAKQIDQVPIGVEGGVDPDQKLDSDGGRLIEYRLDRGKYRGTDNRRHDHRNVEA